MVRKRDRVEDRRVGMPRISAAVAVLVAAAVVTGAAVAGVRAPRAGEWRVWWGQVTLRSGGATLTSQVPTAPAETHSALATTTQSFRDQTISFDVTTLEQLRTGSEPNPWEVGWVMFHFRDLANYYWFLVKPNGFELGKKQGSDTQIFLQTGTLPASDIGRPDHVQVRLRGARIRVTVNGVQVVDYTDANPIGSGSVGLYEEDSHVRFDSLTFAS